jgi:hypothetical protein
MEPERGQCRQRLEIAGFISSACSIPRALRPARLQWLNSSALAGLRKLCCLSAKIAALSVRALSQTTTFSTSTSICGLEAGAGASPPFSFHNLHGPPKASPMLCASDLPINIGAKTLVLGLQPNPLHPARTSAISRPSEGTRWGLNGRGFLKKPRNHKFWLPVSPLFSDRLNYPFSWIVRGSALVLLVC